jgi:hypothetical protein
MDSADVAQVSPSCIEIKHSLCYPNGISHFVLERRHWSSPRGGGGMILGSLTNSGALPTVRHVTHKAHVKNMLVFQRSASGNVRETMC